MTSKLPDYNMYKKITNMQPDQLYNNQLYQEQTMQLEEL